MKTKADATFSCRSPALLMARPMVRRASTSSERRIADMRGTSEPPEASEPRTSIFQGSTVRDQYSGEDRQSPAGSSHRFACRLRRGSSLLPESPGTRRRRGWRYSRGTGQGETDRRPRSGPPRPNRVGRVAHAASGPAEGRAERGRGSCIRRRPHKRAQWPGIDMDPSPCRAPARKKAPEGALLIQGAAGRSRPAWRAATPSATSWRASRSAWRSRTPPPGAGRGSCRCRNATASP